MNTAKLGIAVLAAVAVQSVSSASMQESVLGLADGKQDTGRTIRLEKTVRCTPDRTFALWSTDDGVQSFLAPASRIGRSAGEEYTILFSPTADPHGASHGTRGARILALSPPRFLAFEWIAFAGDASLGRNAPPLAAPSFRNESPPPTWVEIDFLPAPDAGTRVVFRHYGFREGELWSASQAWFTRAWAQVLDGLAAVCGREQVAKG